MFNIGPMELMVILVIALLVVGPKRLPEVGRSIGKGLREFRRAQDEVTRTIRTGLDDIDADTGDGSTAEAPDGSGPPGESGAGPPTGGDAATDAVRTLGRSLAELRRAREELQRSFRVDLNELTKPSGSTRRSPPSPSSQAGPPVPSEAPPDPSGTPE